MKKCFIWIFALLITGSTVFARNLNDGKYHPEHHYGKGSWGYWNSQKWDDDDREDYEKWQKKQYKKWYKQCLRYHGTNCTYAYWNRNSNWNEDNWFNHWNNEYYNSDAYRKIQKVNRKANILWNIMDSTKELFK